MIQDWKLLSKKDASVGKWLPVELRTYELPDGRVVEDFSVVTLADVAMVVPITPEGKVVMVQQYKPGYGGVTIEFPAGRKESHHSEMLEVAEDELLEETGMKAETLELVGSFGMMVTKATERVYAYLGHRVIKVGTQKLDETEDIEVVEFIPSEIDAMIADGRIDSAATMAAWMRAKELFL